MTKNPPIIVARNVQPTLSRLRDIVLTVLMWVAYIYLMRDFFDFIGTILSWVVLGITSPELQNAIDVLRTVGYYVVVVLINSSILIGWAVYNQIRFRGKDRRKKLTPIGPSELGKLYNVTAQEVAEWQGLRSMTMYHDPQGNLVRIEPK